MGPKTDTDLSRIVLDTVYARSSEIANTFTKRLKVSTMTINFTFPAAILGVTVLTSPATCEIVDLAGRLASGRFALIEVP